MTPEDAQRLTEEKWGRLAAGESTWEGGRCGWCMYAGRCRHCPVVRVLECRCEELAVMQRQRLLLTPDTARAVLDHLREHGELFIKMAKEMADG